uniref:Uncharacterized protein AlNc14C60G4443 n=1 Tax=Albugo laibachii Nc14 TaxID=890382 RepID=F0WCR4_9STRA|nr:conserved hypothetical protein [Albugo laibachii Nc14]|eukprot:CCA18985.1 conserved hypothetical protein [Albugo laibachii Nc14]
MLDISLLHGWIVDDQDLNTTSVIDHKSYNELIEILANYRASLMTEHETSEVNAKQSSEKTENLQEQYSDRNSALQLELVTENAKQIMDDRIQSELNGSEPSHLIPGHRHSFIGGSLSGSMNEADVVDVRKAADLQEQGPVLEEFFDSSASQLTYFGLIKLHEDVRERQLCVFFRNNHFSTLFKYEGSLFLLVTDTGYLDEPTVVWEHLTEIDGDTDYYNAEFKPLNTTETRQQTIFNQQGQQPHLAKATSKHQISQISRKDEADTDYLLAVKLQKEEEALANIESSTPNIGASNAIESAHLGPQRVQAKDVAINSNNISSDTPTAQTQQAAWQGLRNSASDRPKNFVCDSDGRVLLSKEEIEAQRQAETYFKEQKEKQDRTHGASYLGRITNTARRTSARRVDKQSDCSIM